MDRDIYAYMSVLGEGVRIRYIRAFSWQHSNCCQLLQEPLTREDKYSKSYCQQNGASVRYHIHVKAYLYEKQINWPKRPYETSYSSRQPGLLMELP